MGFLDLSGVEKRLGEFLSKEEVKARLEVVLDSSSDGILFVDDKGVIVRVNKRLLKMSGLPKKHFINKRLSDISFIPNHLLSKSHVKFNLPSKGLLVELSVFTVKQKKLVGRVFVFKDLSLFKKLEELELKRKEEELLNELKSKFFMRVSHELRGPLMPILGYTELLMKENVKQRELLSKILVSANRLKELINKVIELTALESGEIRLRRSRVNLKSLVNDLLKRFDFKVKLVKDLTSVTVRVDKSRITEALFNIVDNAVNSTVKGFIKVSVKREGGNALVIVQDTGQGMNRAKLKRVTKGLSHLFDQEYGVLYEGFKISLMISNLIIKLHQGFMTIDSVVGKGTTVTVSLPLHE